MPCVDYKRIADRKANLLFGDPDVTEINKGYIRQFLLDYEVSDARLSMFLARIRQVLLKTKDIKQDMNNCTLMSEIFRSFRGTYSIATYATLLSITKRFVRWLNQGELPKGFKDIRAVPKKKCLRDLRPDDMVTWEDALALTKATTSIQLKSIILTQLDGGLRPGEFVDLRYRDITVKKNIVLIFVRSAKTGKRFVVLHRSVPYFLRWYHEHPTKRMQDWLWIDENPTKSRSLKHIARRDGSSIKRYEYDAMADRIQGLGVKIDFRKPLDFYNLRHSSAVLKKMDNVPPDLAAQSMGHSVAYYTDIYGRLCADDIVARHECHYGLRETIKEKPKNRNCPCCNFINEPNSEICFGCGAPLTPKKSLEMSHHIGRNENKDEINELKRRLEVSEELMQTMKDQIVQSAIDEINGKLQRSA